MFSNLSDDEIRRIRSAIVELELEHRDLDQLIEQLMSAPGFEELHIKRLKKRKLQLKDQLAKLANQLIPDILA